MSFADSDVVDMLSLTADLFSVLSFNTFLLFSFFVPLLYVLHFFDSSLSLHNLEKYKNITG